MADVKGHISVKVLATILSIALLFGALPQTIASVFATTEDFGVLEVLTSGSVIDNDTDRANVTATFSENTTVEWVDADSASGRNQAGYAVGVKFLAADTFLKEEDFSNEDKFVGYQVYSDGKWSEKISFWDTELSGKTDEEMERYLNLWGYIDEEMLNEAIVSGDNIEFKWQFDWNMDDIYDQSVVVTVVPEKVILNNAGVQVYPSATDNASVEAIGFGADVVGSQANVTTVTQNSKASLAWTTASTDADITSDGWWAGIKVTAPSAYGEAVLKNAVYQVKNDSDDWSENKFFWNNKASLDEDATHFINLHRQLSENLGSEDIVTSWRFDWNNDGIFEQIVILNISPADITLSDANGYQVYPSLGSVVALSGGEVSGTSGNTVVTLTSAEIPYEKANDIIGKTTDGWWAGIKVNAPDFIDDSNIANTEFRYKKYGEDTFTEANFNDEKHSSADASEHWINFWAELSPEIIADAKTVDEDITYIYEFDWDGNGAYEQKVTFNIVPSDSIVLKKIDQTNFEFLVSAPIDQWVGDTYTNTALGGESSGKITYEIIEGSDIATIDETTGKLSFSGTGKVRVQATKAGDDIYEDAVATYTVTVVKLGQTGFKFATTNAEITYQEGAVYTNVASGGESGGKVSYKDLSNNGCVSVNAETGEVTILKAGDVTIEATKEGNGQYNDVTTTYTLKIKKAEQNAITFIDAPSTVKYTTQVIDRDSILNVSGGSGSGEFVFTITSGTDFAEFDLDGNIKIKKAGGAFEVSVVKLGDDCYNDSATITTTITIEKAEQKGFVIVNGSSDTVTFNENNNQYKLEVTGGESNNAVVYEVIEGDCATVDENGLITIVKAGKVKVTATKLADENYEALSAVFELEVKLAAQSFSFKDGKNVSKLYGTTNYKNEIENTEIAGAADGKGYGSGSVKYSIISENNIGATIKEDGTVEFADSTEKVGKITILATKEKDDCYEAVSDTYELTISYLETTDKPTVSGDKTDADNNWYTGNVKIVAPAGYQISKTNDLLSSNWEESVSYDIEKISDATVYLRNNEGFITDAIVVADIRIDTSAPTNLAVEYEKSFVDVVLENVTFGVYQAKTIAVTLKATDTSSGINSFVYTFGNEEFTVTKDEMTVTSDGEAIYTFNIDADARSNISFKAIDVAGRVSEFEDGKILVVDLTAPEINVAYDFGENTPYLVEDITYTKGEFTAEFEITETNFDLAKKEGKLPVISINGYDINLTWEEVSTGIWKASQVIKTAGINEIVVNYEDLSGNTASYNKNICIDGVKPVLSVKFDNNNENSIYNSSRVAEIVITEDYFNASNAEFVVTAKNILGQVVTLPEYTAYLNNAENWIENSSVHTTNVVFGDEVKYDGLYDITFNYVDFAGNEADTWTDSFVIDHTSATDIKIEYSESILDKVLNLVTFGFYQAEAEVTVTATDVTSGVDYFLLTYTKQTDSSDVNKETETVKLVAEATGEADVFTATHKIPANARGTMSVQVFDKAGNDSSKVDNKFLVVDNTVPEIEAEYKFVEDTFREENNIYFTQDKTEITFTITEANFDLIEGKELPAVKVNGEAKAVEWAKVGTEDNWIGKLVLNGNGDYVVTVDFVDLSTNKLVQYEKEIRIDSEKPIISVEYNNNNANNINNYDADRKATITITAHNFKADEVELSVTAKDILGRDVEVEDFENYVRNSRNWRSKRDVHTLVLPVFTVDAKYDVTLDYTDIAGNKADTWTDSFVIDHTPATDIKIEYSESILDKVLNLVTFGFYQAEAEVTVTATDITSGVDYFLLTYTKQTDSSDVNKETETVKLVAEATGEADVFTATHKIPANARGTMSVQVFDKAGNDSSKADGKIIVVDDIAPEIEAKYEFVEDTFREENNIYFTQNETKITFTINEANFDLIEEKEFPVVKVNGEVKDVEWTRVGETDNWNGIVSLSGDGDYVVTVDFVDLSTNTMTHYEKETRIDSVKPEFKVEYSNNEALNTNNYKADRVATLTVTEHNFKADEVVLSVTAKDILGADVEIADFKAYAKNPANWSSKGDIHTLVLPVFTVDAKYDVTLDYTDIAGNKADTWTDSFVIDHTPATDIKIEYSESILDKVLNLVTFGFYQAEAEVTVTATDITSGVDYFLLTYTKQTDSSDVNKETETVKLVAEATGEADVFTATHKIPANARGTMSVQVFDKAGNDSSKVDNKVLVVDNIAPEAEVVYSTVNQETTVNFVDAQNKDVDNFADAEQAFYNGNVKATIVIDEANFFEGKDSADGIVHEVGVKVTKTDENGDVTVIEYLPEGSAQKYDGATVQSIEWTTEGDVHTAVIEYADDADYVLTVEYADFSTNESGIQANDGKTATKSYESKIVTVDKTAPVISVEYDNNDANNTNNYKADRTATITVVEHNFRPDEMVVVVTARDITGEEVTVTDYASYVIDENSWTKTGNVYEAEITYSTDAIYTFDISYADLAKNESADFEEQEFVVDHRAPEDIKIEYSTPILEKVLETITFGMYKADVKLTITAEDVTSGVDYFTLTYNKEADSSDVNTKTFTEKLEAKQLEDNKTFEATYVLPSNARGHFSVDVTDDAANTSSRTDNELVKIVDTLSPEITVEYSATNEETKVNYVDVQNKDVGDFTTAEQAFYNGNVIAKVVIDEANFFEGKEAEDGIIHEVGIKLTKTDNDGNVTEIEYLPSGSKQKYDGATAQSIEWTTEGDVHTAVIEYADDADYVLTVEYADFSTNESGIQANDGKTATKSYESKIVTVDKTAPVIWVEYANENIIHTIDERNYLDNVQSATVTVVEHNFRAVDMIGTVIAENVIGEKVNVDDYTARMSDQNNWVKSGNVYTITLDYPIDANYSFDYEYCDLAKNKASDYVADKFTVDTTAPENLKVEYSTSVMEKVLETITFGYYNAKMQVTISAEDVTAGVHYFVYSYLKNEGVSNVNRELLNDVIADANENIVRDGKKATTSFTIPKDILAYDYQFNGIVEFTAYDKSENNTKKVDNTVIIVDNINPVSKVTYNEPVQQANGISYYAGNIDATIVIDEANFYAEDVIVSVTKDGLSYATNVTWVDNSVDIHTGTFTLTEDGDYVITVKYVDRSTNEMTTYVSNRLTLDTKQPTINVSNIVMNSANKDERYPFTITADDINIDSSSFKPVLTATVRDENGDYQTKTISLGSMKTVQSGKTYAFNVDNLTEDAVYSLVCTVKDMAGNTYSKIILKDGVQYDTVRFSINRNGSTFIANKATEDLAEQYYVYSVDKDIIIEEINVDPIEKYVLKVNGKELVENRDYTSTISSNSGEWSKRTYIISKDLFVDEGEYTIVIESTDKTETTAYSDVKNVNVSFVVDRTKPVLTISGLETGGRYQIDEQTVTVIPTDDGGRLNAIKVIVTDADGNPIKDAKGKDISVRLEMSGDELREYLSENDGKLTFTIPEGVEQNVRIICEDCAVNSSDEVNVYDETFEKVTVSQSGFIIFYANKPAFYGSIAGVVGLAVALFLIIFFKKRKDKNN